MSKIQPFTVFRFTKSFPAMPPKRESGSTPTQPQVKMIKVGSVSDMQDFHCGSVEDKFREAESSHSPLTGNEVKKIEAISQ